jgi:endonuclease-8
LLDQRNLAGIGNLYKSELLFLTGVHPWTPVADVPVDKLVGLSRRLLDANKSRDRQVTTGDPRTPTWVYNRRECGRCGGVVERAMQAGRATYWCPRCQPQS